MFLRHETIEKNVILMVVLTLITVSIGGIVQIIPLFTIESTIERVDGIRPYSPLEVLGRNIYIREGCYTCHSQQIRPFKDEVERYGPYSLAAESMYDKPFQWGYSDAMIANARADLMAQASPDVDPTALLERYPRAVVGKFDSQSEAITEMDALVAYLQMLGTLVRFSDLPPERLRQ